MEKSPGWENKMCGWGHGVHLNGSQRGVTEKASPGGSIRIRTRGEGLDVSGSAKTNTKAGVSNNGGRE